MSQRAREVYERLIAIEKRLTDHFESKTRMVLLWAWKRDIRKNVFKKIYGKYEEEAMSIDKKVYLMVFTMLAYEILKVNTDEHAFSYDFVYDGGKMEHGHSHRISSYS